MTVKFSTGDSIDWNATGIEQLKNNILNIIRTRKGEVPYMPTLGIQSDYVDTPLSTQRASLVSEIRKQLSLWQPEASLDSLSIIPRPSGDYSVEVIISL